MAVLPVGIGPVTGYQISRSLRFNSADSAYLNRTPASAGNRKTWTWSGWIKRSGLAATQVIFSGGDGSSNNDAWLRFDSGDTINFSNLSGGSYTAQVTTSAVFRDPGAWYHLILAIDTTQATGTNRVKIYVNNVQQTVTFTTTPSQNADMSINIAGLHTIGRLNYSATQYPNGYLTEINFIDGQALTPSSFGQTNASTGIWQPIKYTGTYGTNGFYLNFSDNSGTTSTTLGKDSSGNGNNWTPNNFSVTAGAGNDSLVDTPTSYGSDTGVGGEVRGNYATLNPLAIKLGAGGTITVTNGNLDTSDAATTYGYVPATMAVSSGKWYWEVFVTSQSNSTCEIGIKRNTDSDLNNGNGVAGTANSYAYVSSGSKRNNTLSTTYGASWTTNDVISVALDMDAGTLVFYKNGSSQGTAYSSLSGEYFPAFGDFANAGQFNYACNFGQRPFAYTAPSGFKALCTQNLPTPTIGATSTTQANKYFDVLLYTGTGVLTTRTGLNLGTAPGLVWIKSRSAATSNVLEDSNRGTSVVFADGTNSTNAEGNTGGGWMQNFATTGFSTDVNLPINTNGATYVSWVWAGASNVTNTSGTITSTVNANTTAGFSIVTYTGNGVSGATVGHGLGVAPGLVIAKRRSAIQNWGVWHSALAGTQTLYLDLTQGVTTAVWSAAPTSSVLTLTTDGVVNTNGSTYVIYCAAPVAGYSAFGSYTGNGSTDGPFIYTGFRPRWLLVKQSSASGINWRLLDTARDPYNVVGLGLTANTSDAETSGDTFCDILSNGFKVRQSTAAMNTSSATYIYAAFAESPFKYSLAR